MLKANWFFWPVRAPSAPGKAGPMLALGTVRCPPLWVPPPALRLWSSTAGWALRAASPYNLLQQNHAQPTQRWRLEVSGQAGSAASTEYCNRCALHREQTRALGNRGASFLPGIGCVPEGTSNLSGTIERTNSSKQMNHIFLSRTQCLLCDRVFSNQPYAMGFFLSCWLGRVSPACWAAQGSATSTSILDAAVERAGLQASSYWVTWKEHKWGKPWPNPFCCSTRVSGQESAAVHPPSYLQHE